MSREQIRVGLIIASFAKKAQKSLDVARTGFDVLNLSKWVQGSRSLKKTSIEPVGGIPALLNPFNVSLIPFNVFFNFF